MESVANDPLMIRVEQEREKSSTLEVLSSQIGQNKFCASRIAVGGCPFIVMVVAREI